MKIEVAIHFSDHTERHSFNMSDGALVALDLSRQIDMPAFTGTLHGPTIEIRVIK